MTYYGVPTNSDDRAKKGLVPVRLRNVMIRPTDGGSARGNGVAAVSRPGLVRRSTPNPGGNIRGLFSEPGVYGGDLFAVAGFALYRANIAWTMTSLGPVYGTDGALFDALLSSLALVANGHVFEYDGVSLAQVTDIHAPSPAETLSVLGARGVVSQRGTDILSWCAVANLMDWPALGFTSAELSADPIVATIVIGPNLIVLGAKTLQLVNSVGGNDEEAFQPDPTYLKHLGCLRRDTLALVDESPMFVGDDRVLYRLAGYQPERVINRALNERLAALSESQVDALRGFSYTWREKALYCLRMPDGGPSFEYDGELGVFYERTSFERDNYLPGMACDFNGDVVIAGPEDDGLYTFEDDAFDDDGEPIERIITFHVPVKGPVSIDSIVFDIKVLDQPLQDDDGEPYVPKMRTRYYFDGGSLDSVTEWDDERVVNLPAAGDYGIPEPETRFGLARGPAGFLIECIITDPVRFAFFGIWVNEYPE